MKNERATLLHNQSQCSGWFHRPPYLERKQTKQFRHWSQRDHLNYSNVICSDWIRQVEKLTRRRLVKIKPTRFNLLTSGVVEEAGSLWDLIWPARSTSGLTPAADGTLATDALNENLLFWPYTPGGCNEASPGGNQGHTNSALLGKFNLQKHISVTGCTCRPTESSWNHLLKAGPVYRRSFVLVPTHWARPTYGWTEHFFNKIWWQQQRKKYLTSNRQGWHENSSSYTSVLQVTHKTSITTLILISIKAPHQGVHLSSVLGRTYVSRSPTPPPHPLSLPPLERVY